MSLRNFGGVFLGLLLVSAAPPAPALDAAVNVPAEESAPLPPLPAPLQAVRAEDRGALEVLSLYQEPLRTVLLQVARQPRTLIALESAQAETRRGFQELIEPLPEEERAHLWELVRYPELVEALVGSEAKTRAEIDAVTREHPEEIRAAARIVSGAHLELLREIQRLQLTFEAAFDRLLRELDAEASAAFRTALAHPELLEILSAHMHLSVLLGELYERDPQNLERALASLANDVAARTAGAREDWIRSLEEDPEARAELEQAAEDYAREQGIDYIEETGSQWDTRVALLVSPYPYWFGFPGAYVGFYYGFYPYAGYWWYPYHHHPFGFYYGPRHRIVVYGFPSHYFLSWYFGGGSRHERYSHLSRHFARHCGVHRYSHDRVSLYVQRWERTRAPRKERVGGSGSRVARLREFAGTARASRARAYERPERRRRWDWLLGNPDRSRFERTARDIESSEPARIQERKRPSAQAPSRSRETDRTAPERSAQPRPRRNPKRDVDRAPRGSSGPAIGKREMSRQRAPHSSGGSSARAKVPRAHSTPDRPAARSMQQKGAIGKNGPKPAGRGAQGPRARGHGSRDR